MIQPTKLLKFIVLFIFALTISCESKKEKTASSTTEKSSTIKEESFKLWTWITAEKTRTDESFDEEFEKYGDNGLDAILINTYGDPELLARLVPIAKKHNLEVHAWMFTMNRPGDKIAEQHPEWYAVSRDGKSCFDEPPYVGYYKWLCPTRKESREHVLSLIEGLVKVEGVASFHLDYIRYSDIFLPIGLLPKYDLKQETELARYDFCYCDVCTSEFEKEHHKNPKDFRNPAIDMEWKNFRLNKVKAIVDEAYKITHENGKQLTAAVFPYPEMADHMVRQRWDKWQVDAVLPMIYNVFYNEEIDWIGYATKQGVEDLKGKDTELHTGIYVPEMTPEQLKEAIYQAKSNGAKGVSFFDGPAITDDQWRVISASQNP
ncbi:family 10 glycosylhydrolase [Maribacter stanieri]|uniref:Glycosyl hydrolase-like 10 n=1 Tax=Maribacter stanieri TaxID=440514 RepID=A0A1I6I704_9FLAO|nr:family 10 glycosylhydrolase [Maribacter stanieri]SFR62434.1 Glycosyl hydrolase-like 10 [Maribacter stanieri]